MRIVDEWKGYIEKNIFNVKIGFVMWTLYRLDLALLTMIMDYGKVHPIIINSLTEVCTDIQRYPIISLLSIPNWNLKIRDGYTDLITVPEWQKNHWPK